MAAEDRGNAELLDAAEVAVRLHLSVAVIRRMAKSSRIPALVIRNGARDYYRFRLPEVEEALRNQYKADPS